MSVYDRLDPRDEFEWIKSEPHDKNQWRFLGIPIELFGGNFLVEAIVSYSVIDQEVDLVDISAFWLFLRAGAADEPLPVASWRQAGVRPNDLYVSAWADTMRQATMEERPMRGSFTASDERALDMLQSFNRGHTKRQIVDFVTRNIMEVWQIYSPDVQDYETERRIR